MSATVALTSSFDNLFKCLYFTPILVRGWLLLWVHYFTLGQMLNSLETTRLFPSPIYWCAPPQLTLPLPEIGDTCESEWPRWQSISSDVSSDFLARVFSSKEYAGCASHWCRVELSGTSNSGHGCTHVAKLIAFSYSCIFSRSRIEVWEQTGLQTSYKFTPIIS